MKTGTAIGLLVGGAVLILAAKPSTSAASPYGTTGTGTTALPGGALNPFNWFNGSMSNPTGSGAIQPSMTPNGGLLQPSSYYGGGGGGIFGTPSANLAQPVNYNYMTPPATIPALTPSGGLQSAAYNDLLNPQLGPVPASYTPGGGILNVTPNTYGANAIQVNSTPAVAVANTPNIGGGGAVIQANYGTPSANNTPGGGFMNSTL